MADKNDLSEQLRNQSDERKKIDISDLAQENMGLENTGRIKRFINEDIRKGSNSSKQKAKHQAEQLSRLQQLLISNTAYATLYNDTMDQLREAELRTEQEIERLTENLFQAQTNLNTILDNAAQLRSRVRVFKDAEGRVWTEHDEEVTGEALNEIVWNGNEPSREEYLAQRHLVTDTQTALQNWQSYQVGVLGSIRYQLTNEKEPPTTEGLNEFQSIMRDQVPEMSTNQRSQTSDTKAEALKQPTADQILNF